MDFPAFPATAALPPVVTKVKDKLKVCSSSVAKQQLTYKLLVEYAIHMAALDVANMCTNMSKIRVCRVVSLACKHRTCSCHWISSMYW